MKICYISNSAMPSDNASSLQIVKMCEHLQILGNEVTLILPNTGFRTSYYNFYNLKKNFNVIKCKKFNKFPIGINYYLYSIYSIYLSTKTNFKYYITRNFFTAFLLLLIQKKVIFELHTDLNIEGRFVRLLVKYFKFLKYKNLVKLVCITNGVKNYYIKNKLINNKKTIILPSATELKFDLKKKINFNKKLKIGYFGSFYESRGSKFIYNLAKIDDENNYYVYTKLKKKKIHFLKNLFISDFLDRKKIVNKMKKIDIFIMPYQKGITAKGDVGDISSFTSPMKLFDYLAAGKVIIASELKVLKEILTHNKNCIFIKNFTNIFDWKIAIKKLKNSPKKYNMLSKNAYMLSKKYSYTIRAKKILEKLN
tara:strand:- start:744 stop:1841 length:1098 start_codon:yes stop_codon:yes gene_type:complete